MSVCRWCSHSEGPCECTGQQYRTIVADPPWHYEGFATMPGSPLEWGHATKRAPMPYPTMTLDGIRALPIGALAADDALLFLWTTNRYLPDSFGVAEAWGFTYRQTLVWHKTGNPSPFGGSVAPNHAEYLIVAAKGKPEITGRLAGSVIAVPKPHMNHSEKPEAFLDFIETLSPGPYVEIFARRNRLDWDTWGNEALEHVQIDSTEGQRLSPDPENNTGAQQSASTASSSSSHPSS